MQYLRWYFVVTDWVLWGLLIISNIYYFLLPVPAASETKPFDENSYSFFLGLVVGSFVIVAIAYGVRKFCLGWAEKTRLHPASFFGGLLFSVLCLVTWILVQVVAIYGLVGFFIWAEKWILSLFVACSLVLMVYWHPMSWKISRSTS